MQESIDQLAKRLYEKNPSLTINEARTWVELLWEDFDATRAKAGREYQGAQVTEQIVLRWIDQYGPNLHQFLERHPKYQKMFDDFNS